MVFHPRPATTADLATLHDIDRTCFPLTDPQSVPAAPGDLQSGVDRDDILLGEWDGDPVGFLQRTITPQRVVIEALAVLPRFRRRGIARRLLAEVLRPLHAGDQQFRLVEAVTSPQNVAMVGLLTSQGFSAGELVRDHFGPGRHRLVFQWYSGPPRDISAADHETLSAVLRAGYRVTGYHAATDGAHLELSTAPPACERTDDPADTRRRPPGSPTPGDSDRLHSASVLLTVPVIRNAQAPWADFNPVAYWKRNYELLLPIDREILTLTSMYFAGFREQLALPRPVDGVRARDIGALDVGALDIRALDIRALDIGTGTNLYPALAMLPLADRITLADLSPPNIAWLRENLSDLAEPWPWQSFWQHMSRCVQGTDRAWDYRPDRDVRRELGERAELRQESVFELPRAEWHIGTMFFVAESITGDLNEFKKACTCFLQSLKPGAPFAAAFMAGSSGYRIANTNFPAVKIGYLDVRAALAEHVNPGRLQLHEFHPSPDDTFRDNEDENEYSSMVLALGTIREDRCDEGSTTQVRC